MAKPKATKPTRKKSPKAVRGVRTVDKSWHPRFLQVLGTMCNVTLAVSAAGVNKTTAYEHYKTQPDFAAQWDEAKESAIEILEAEAWNRARKQSDLLLIFLLKAHKPGMYREKVEVKHEGELQHTVVRLPAKATNLEEWEHQQKESKE